MTTALPRTMAAMVACDAIERARDSARRSNRRPPSCLLPAVRRPPILSAQLPDIDAPDHVWDEWERVLRACLRP